MCPADAKSAAQCRASAGVCDVAENCDGVSNDCPADAFEPTTTTCTGTSNGGVCDATDHCSGTADSCIDEISADPSPSWLRFYSAIVGWILRTLFDGVSMNLDGLAAVKRMALRGPVVYVPCHKSHVDYLILSYMLYNNDLPCPLIAAGKNLSFWPMGPLFRRGGAFFIRRSFRGAVLYSRVFAEYVHTILEEGYPVEQFIEGGRSRTGKLLMPKLGLLSILLNAQKNGACEDLIFVPVSIGYDRVLEEKSYLQEIEGGQKQPENVWQVVSARKFLKHRYGKVYLQFHAPLSVNDLAERSGTPLKAMKPKEFNGFCRSLGHRIAHAINQVSVVTPQALAAAAILNGGRDRFDLEALMAVVDLYTNHLDAVKAAIDQGAFIFWNHPGWKQPDGRALWYAEQEEVFQKGWLHGLEIVNGTALSVLLFLAAVKLVRLTVYIIMGAVLLQALLSWVNPYHPVAPFFEALTRPFLKPFQKAVPPIGGVDITPVLVLIACQLVLMLPVTWLETESLRMIARFAL